MFAIHGIVALPIRVFIFSFQYKYRINLSGSTVQTSDQLVKSKSLEYVNNYAFLCIVMCILLIILGIEMNPGPSDLDLSSSSVVSVQPQRLKVTLYIIPFPFFI